MTYKYRTERALIKPEVMNELNIKALQEKTLYVTGYMTLQSAKTLGLLVMIQEA
jgi:hypothetical protein